MTERGDKPSSSLVSEAAARWFQLLQDPQLDFEQRHEFVGWLKRSPDHLAEFLRIWRLDRHLRRVELAEPVPHGAASEEDVE